jgi:predicted HTH transcriptional regulator
MNEQQDIEFKSQLQQLLKEGIIKRICPDRGGHWKVRE